MRRLGRRDIRAVALVTALVLALGVTPSALAAPAPPSWDEVEQAKGDVEATEIAIARIVDAVRALEEQYAAAARAALERGEQYQLAVIALDEADLTLRTLERRRDAALARADESGRRAAQLAAQLARAGSGDIATALLVSGTEADDLLYRLGTMSALTARSDGIMARALQDRNVAAVLAEQADLALDERRRLADEAQTVFADASDAAAAAEAQVAEQEAAVTVLAAQLATLTGRSAALEREYLDGLAAEGGEGGGGEGGGGGPGSPSPSIPPSPSPSAPAPSAPSPSAPSPSPSVPAPSPSTTAPSAPPTTTVPAPNATIVAAAIAFAKAQLGEPYLFGGAGPSAWDCSGLTMMAYSAAGLSIGGHSVTMQYTRAATRGQLLPYAQAQAGDLIFYSYGGSAAGSKYHVAIYLGGGQMIEAPSPGKPVRIVAVRSYDRIPVVARPSA